MLAVHNLRAETEEVRASPNNHMSPARHTAYNSDMKPTPGSGFSSSHSGHYSSWFEATAASSLLGENSKRAPRNYCNHCSSIPSAYIHS